MKNLEDRLLTQNGHPIVADENGQWFLIFGYDHEQDKYIGFNVMSQTLLDPDDISLVHQSDLDGAEEE